MRFRDTTFAESSKTISRNSPRWPSRTSLPYRQALTRSASSGDSRLAEPGDGASAR